MTRDNKHQYKILNRSNHSDDIRIFIDTKCELAWPACRFSDGLRYRFGVSSGGRRIQTNPVSSVRSASLAHCGLEFLALQLWSDVSTAPTHRHEKHAALSVSRRPSASVCSFWLLHLVGFFHRASDSSSLRIERLTHWRTRRANGRARWISTIGTFLDLAGSGEKTREREFTFLRDYTGTRRARRARVAQHRQNAAATARSGSAPGGLTPYIYNCNNRRGRNDLAKGGRAHFFFLLDYFFYSSWTTL